MSLFITAVPLFAADMSVTAYRMRHQVGEKLLGLNDDYTLLSGITDAPDIDIINRVGLEPFAGDKPLFLSVNKYQILSHVPETLKASPGTVYFVLREDTIDDFACLDFCVRLKAAGYGIAVESFFRAKDATQISNYLLLSDYVLLDTTRKEYKECLMKVLSHNRRQKFVLTNVPSNEAFSALKSVRNALYEGRFYNEPITANNTRISALKLNALQLLRLISQDDFDLTDVSDIIKMDPAISIALLRFINSPDVKVSQKITSISNAVALLGQKETRKWISAAVSVKLSEDKPNEITKLSLIRAKFAENLSASFEMAMFSQSLFMLGLFSLLDVILEQPMSEAVEVIALDSTIRDALVDHKGRYYDVLQLIYNYERAEWESVSLVMIRYNIPAKNIETAFLEALIWYRDLLKMQDAMAEELE